MSIRVGNAGVVDCYRGPLDYQWSEITVTQNCHDSNVERQMLRLCTGWFDEKRKYYKTDIL